MDRTQHFGTRTNLTIIADNWNLIMARTTSNSHLLRNQTIATNSCSFMYNDTDSFISKQSAFP